MRKGLYLLFLGILLMGTGSKASALESGVIILLEVLDHPEEGCGFWTPQGEFENAHIAIGTGIETDEAGNAEVVQSSMQLCDIPESGLFGPPVDLPGNYGSVAVGAGTDGFHPVELSLPAPFAINPGVNQVRVGVYGENELGEAFFLLSTQSDNDTPIVWQFMGSEPVSVPAVGFIAIVVLVGGLVLTTLWYSRRAGLLVLLVAVSGGGLVARGLDFQFDWDEPPLAEAELPDPDDSLGVRSLFASLVQSEEPRLAFRMDLALEPDTLVVNAWPDPLTLWTGASGGSVITLEHDSDSVTIFDITPDLSGTALEGQVEIVENTCSELAPSDWCYISFAPGDQPVSHTDIRIDGENMEPIFVGIRILD